MEKQIPIRDIFAREILDSRGNPTVEVEVLAGEDVVGRASVPSGASTGTYEAVELRDGEKRYGGNGVEQAVENVNSRIARIVIGMNVFDQEGIDRALIKADGTADKSRLGANAILGVSLAAAHAAATALKLPLYRYLGGVRAKQMPCPYDEYPKRRCACRTNTLDIQEFMILPAGADSFRERLRMCAEVYHALKGVLRDRGLNTSVGDEGGFAPDLPDTREALRTLREAVEKAGYRLGRDIRIALDAAASELYDKDAGKYRFPGESRMQGHAVERTTEEMIAYYEDLISEFPVCSIEDPLDEEDWEGWRKITERLGDRVQLCRG